MLFSFLSRGMVLALTCCGWAMAAPQAEAQSWRFQFHRGGWPSHDTPSSSRHSSHRPADHVPDLHVLDRASNTLTQLVSHLHDDAHGLSTDYYHATEIERTVTQLEELKAHMHELIHQASRHGRYSSSLDRHLKDDFRKVKHLLQRLASELEHQSFDGVCRADFQRIQHMREIIAWEAVPWLRLMERELYGPERSHYSHCGANSRWGALPASPHPRAFEERRVEGRFEPPSSPPSSRFRFSF